jgi:hypothetical protein
MAFLVGRSGHKLKFLSGFLPSFFPFYKMLFMNRPEFSFFADIFFVRIFKTREEYGLLLNPPVEGTCE